MWIFALLFAFLNAAQAGPGSDPCPSGCGPTNNQQVWHNTVASLPWISGAEMDGRWYFDPAFNALADNEYRHNPPTCSDLEITPTELIANNANLWAQWLPSGEFAVCASDAVGSSLPSSLTLLLPDLADEYVFGVGIRYWTSQGANVQLTSTDTVYSTTCHRGQCWSQLRQTSLTLEPGIGFAGTLNHPYMPENFDWESIDIDIPAGGEVCFQLRLALENFNTCP